MVKKKTKINKTTSRFCSCWNYLSKNRHTILFFLMIVFLFVVVIGLWGRLVSRAQSEIFFPTNCFGIENADKAQGISDGETVSLNNSSLALACEDFTKDGQLVKIFTGGSQTNQDQRKIKSARLQFDLKNNSDISQTKKTGDSNPGFVLKYSLDGENWHKAGDVFIGDTSESFEIPLKFAYEIDQLQIALEPADGSSDPSNINIDSFSLEAVFEDPLTAETLNSLKKVEIGKDDAFENPRSSFQAGEDVEFTIKTSLIPKDVSGENPVVAAPILDQGSLEIQQNEVPKQETVEQQKPVGAQFIAPESEENIPSEPTNQGDIPSEIPTENPAPTPDLTPTTEIPVPTVETPAAPVIESPAPTTVDETQTPTSETPAPTDEVPVPESSSQTNPNETAVSPETDQSVKSESIVDQVLSFLRGNKTYAEDLSPQVVTASITDAEGVANNTTPVIDIVDGVTKVIIPKPAGSFRPGKYNLHIEIADGAGNLLISDQTFVWGVLAINLDKTVYLPGETSYIQMSALDDKGSTVCGANLQLEITDPNGTESILTTANGYIASTQCARDNVTNTPDYYSYFTTSEIGEYQMKLTNLDNGYFIQDSFEVRSFVPITIERVGATRINPFKSDYQMTFNITANEDFSGTFEERISSLFEIIDPAVNGDTPYSSLTGLGDKQLISWNLNLASGESTTIIYTYSAPKVSPQLYLLGPASAGSLFTEKRSWQIASDAACSSNTTPMNWNVAGNWTCGHVPTSADDVTIANGHVVTLDVDGTTINSLTITGTNTDTSLTFSGTNSLTITGNVTLNQPTAIATNAWNINDGSANVGGNVSLIGAQGVAVDYISKVIVTSGSLTIGGGIVFNLNALSVNKIVSVTSGTITVNGAESFLRGGTIQNITSPGTIIFNSTFAFGRPLGSYPPVFTTMPGTTLKFASDVTVTSDPLTYDPGSIAEFTASSIVSGNAAITFGSLKITAGILTLGRAITVAGDWTNNSSASALTGNFVVTMNGASNVIGGAYLTPFYGLLITSSASAAAAITLNTACSVGAGNFVITPANYATTFTQASGINLTITGAVTLNQPTADSITSAWYINDGSANVTGAVTFGGASANARASQLIVTSGSLAVNHITFNLGSITESNEVVSLTSGTITFNGADSLDGGTIQNTTAPGTFIFNNTFAYGNASAGYDPILTTMPGTLLKFANNVTTASDALTLDPGSIVEFTASSTVSGNAAITFGSLKITAGILTLGRAITVAGDWENNFSATALTGNYVVTMNGSGKVIGGTYSTPFYGLTIASGASAAASITPTTAFSVGAGGFTITPGAYATSFTQSSGMNLTISGPVILNQPTAAVTSGWYINDNNVNVTGNVTLAGTTATANYISTVVVTSGSLTVGGVIVFGADTTATNKIISFASGTITINGSEQFYGGTIQNINFPGTIIFNGGVFVGVVTNPVFTTMSGTLVKINVELYLRIGGTGGLVFDPNSTVEFIGDTLVYPYQGGAITYGNVKITSGTVNISGNYAPIVAGDWINNSSASALTYAVNYNITMNGSGKVIGGTYSTPFYGLVIASSASAAANITLNTSCSLAGNLTITPGNYATTFTQASGKDLTIAGAVTLNQPTAAVTSGWYINDNNANVTGNVTLAGTTTTDGYVSTVVVTSGSLTVGISIVFGADTTEANKVISFTSGTITLNAISGYETFSSGTIQNITYPGTIIFDTYLYYGNVTAGYDPVFTTMSGTTIKFAGVGSTSGGTVRATSDNLTFDPGSMVEFIGDSIIYPYTSQITFGNLKITSGTVTLSGNSGITVAGDWENNSSATALTALYGYDTVTMNGVGKVIKGTYSTPFYGLVIASSASAAASITPTTAFSVGAGGFTITPGAYATSFTQPSGFNLTIAGNVTMNQPTADNITSAWYINDGSASVSGNITFVGTSTNARVSQIIVTSGSLIITNDINFANDTTEANQVVSVESGTITINGAETFGAGTIQNITSPGTIIFNNTLAFGSVAAGYDPIFTTMVNTLVKFANNVTTTADALTLDPGSTVEFAGNSTVSGTGAIIFGNTKITSGIVTLGRAITVSGDWENNSSASALTGNYTVTMNGAGKVIGGTYSTPFYGLTIASSASAAASITPTTAFSVGAGGFTITPGAYATSFTQPIGFNLTIAGNVTMNQPTADSITSSWNINGNTASVGGNITLAGTTSTASRVSAIVVTSGSLTVTGTVTFPYVTTPASKLLTVDTGTITIKTLEDIRSGTMSITSTGTMDFQAGLYLFNGVTLGDAVVFTQSPGATVKLNTTFTSGNAAYTFTAGSTEEFTGNTNIGIGVTTTFANFKITSGIVTLGAGLGITVAGDWENNSSAGALTGNQVVTMNGAGKVIKGTYSTSFYGLTIASSASAAATITPTTAFSVGAGGFTITPGAYATTFTQPSGFDLTITGNVTLNQPTAAVTSAWYINGNNATVTGNITFAGSNATANYVSTVVVTSGSLTVNGNIAFAADTTAANDVVSFTSGTITINGAETFNNGIIKNITTPGTIIFNNALVFGNAGASNNPVFTTMSETLVKFANNLTASYDTMNFDPGSTAEFTANSTVGWNATNAFGNLKITAGTITLASAITVAGDWENNSSASALTGNYAVTMNGAGKVIGGTYSTPFYGLTIASSASAAATITLNTSCSVGAGSFAIVPGAYATTFTQSSGIDLTVTGTTISMVQPTAAVTSAWNINAGTVTVNGVLSFAGFNNTAGYISALNITTGTLTVNGNLNFQVNSNYNDKVVNISDAGIVKITGAIINPYPYVQLYSNPASTWIFNGTAAGQSIPVRWGFANIQILNTNAAGAYPDAAITSSNVTGNITVGDDSGTAAIFKNGSFNIAGAGAKTFTVKNGATFQMDGTTATFPTGFGTFTFGATSNTIYNQTSAQTITSVASPGYGNLTLSPAATVTYQFGSTSGNFLVQGNLIVGDGSHALTASGTTNDPAINVPGNVTINIGAIFAASDTTSSTISIGGNWANSGTFTNNNGTVLINGTSAGQTLSGTMTGASAFKTLTITNNAGTDPDISPSVIFLSPATAATFNAITPSTKIRFNAGSTYTFTNFNVNGQAAGTRIQLRSSSSPTQWLLVASGTPVAYNTNPKDSDASGGIAIDSTDTSNLNGGNNINWNFGYLTSDIVDSGGNHVANPVYPFQNAPLSFTCQSSAGNLGDIDQKIRVSNDSSNPQWTLSIAATDGNTALWNASGTTFDFNSSTGSGCTNGQLNIDPLAATVIPKSGCTNAGISKSSSASFIQGSVDNITLLQSDGSAATGCYWDLTGAGLTQKIPTEQSIGNYSIDMTITATAY